VTEDPEFAFQGLVNAAEDLPRTKNTHRLLTELANYLDARGKSLVALALRNEEWVVVPAGMKKSEVQELIELSQEVGD